MTTLRTTLIVAALATVASARSAHAQVYYDPYAAQQAAAYEAYVYQQQQQAAYQAYLQQLREQAELQQRQNEENGDAIRGMYEIQTNGWGRINARVLDMVAQLESYSGFSFTVIPSQSGTWGQAHNGGIIQFDVSSAMQSDSVLAFRLAHEWGHEALGHTANIYNPTGSTWRRVSTPTELEDEADVYAGAFVCSKGYDLDEVKAALRRYPTITGDSHSGGAKRAQNVQRGCDSVRSSEDAEPSWRSRSSIDDDTSSFDSRIDDDYSSSFDSRDDDY